MQQATLSLDPQAVGVSPTPEGADGAGITDRAGFDIGWDHARHGLVPAAELLLDGTPIGQGWRAAKAVLGHRTLAAPRPMRLWMALRTQAWREGVAFDPRRLTPSLLARILADHCPVLRTPLGGGAGDADAAVIERVNPGLGCESGNLVMLSRRAAEARAGVDVLQAVRRAHLAHAGAAPVHGLDAGAWWRLAVLRAGATRLPFHEAARLPLALLPPPGLQSINPVQALQALVTLAFAAPGWSARTRALAGLLPEHTLRQDFNLFVGALAPRVIEAGAQDLRQTLEDAWLNERVQRRWQHFALSLGEAEVAGLLDRAVAQGLAGVHMPAPGERAPAAAARRWHRAGLLPRAATRPQRAC